MTILNRFTRQLLGGVLATAIVLVAASVRAEDVEQIVTVLKVKGNARYSNDAMKTWHQLHKGDQLPQGSLIQTAEDGQVDLMMGEKLYNPTTPIDYSGGHPINYKPDNKSAAANVLHLFPSTVMVVDKLSLQRTGADEVSETQLDLRAGQIVGTTKKLSGGSRYEVKIPNGVAGIRGTTFLIGANGTVYVLTGSVVISYVDSNGVLRTTTVTAGNSFTPIAGGAGVTAPLTPAMETALSKVPNPLSGPTTYNPGSAPGLIVHISPN